MKCVFVYHHAYSGGNIIPYGDTHIVSNGSTDCIHISIGMEGSCSCSCFEIPKRSSGPGPHAIPCAIRLHEGIKRSEEKQREFHLMI